MALPDFLIIGAMKCGTSTLQAQLAAQPGIFMTTPKEPNFFSDDPIYARGMAWYEALFDDAQPGDLKGEASTHYTKLPTYPNCVARLAKTLKMPKCIYLVRHPVVRAVSHYIHEWTMGTMSGEIDEAFSDHHELISYSCYAQQIAPYVDAFGTERILLLSQEELQRAPQETLDRVGRFLARDTPFIWQPDKAQVNASAQRIRRLPLHEILIDNPIATALRRRLVPQSLRDRIKNTRQMTARPEPSADLTRRLETVFTQDYSRLRKMFPHHDTLAASYPFVAR